MCRSSTDIEVHCGLNISRNLENEKLRNATTCVSALLTLEFITLDAGSILVMENSAVYGIKIEDYFI